MVLLPAVTSVLTPAGPALANALEGFLVHAEVRPELIFVVVLAVLVAVEEPAAAVSAGELVRGVAELVADLGDHARDALPVRVVRFVDLLPTEVFDAGGDASDFTDV